jgi:hypothetical protein
MGEVFLAAAAGGAGVSSGTVALKILRSELASDTSFVQMMIDEARISRFLNHQNIVAVLDFAQDGGDYYLAMEYVQGTTVERLLEELRRSGREPDIAIGLYIASELCRALGYAHACVNHLGQALNIVHRDVTPANVLLSIQGEVKLTDFGIARAVGRLHETQAGVVKGRFGYLAPEATRGERIDMRADLFSAGVMIYHLLTGRHPVHDAPVMEAIFRFEEGTYPRPSEVNPEIPASLDAVVMRALAPDPEERWATAADLGEAIEEVVLESPQLRRGAQAGAAGVVKLLRQLMPSVFHGAPQELLEGSGDTARILSGEFGDATATDLAALAPRVPENPTLEDIVNPETPFLDTTTSANAFAEEPTASIPAFGDKTTTDIPLMEQGYALVDDGSPSPWSGSGFGEHTAIDRRELQDRDPSFGGAGTEIALPAFFDPSKADRHRDERTREDLAPFTDFGEKTRTSAPPLDWSNRGEGRATIVSGVFDLDEKTRAEPMRFSDSDSHSDSQSDSHPGSGFHEELRAALRSQSGASLPAAISPAPRSKTPPESWDGETLKANEQQLDDEIGIEPTRLRRSDQPVVSGVPAAAVVEPASIDRGGGGFGTNTQNWISGDLKASDLGWDDEAAARRAIATRHRVQAAPSAGAHVIPPNAAYSSSAPRVAPAPAQPSGSPSLGSRSPFLASPTLERNAMAKNRFTIIAFVALAIAFGTIAGVLTYPRVLRPMLNLSTEPPGASVVVNGEHLSQRTPLTIEVAPDRVQRVEFQLEGYLPEAREVRGLDRGQTYQITVDLLPIPPPRPE